MSSAPYYNTTDGTSKTLIGNYVEERALLNDTGGTRGTHIHTKLHTKTRIMGNIDENVNINNHYSTTTHQSYNPQSITQYSNQLPSKSSIRQQQYTHAANQLLQKQNQQKQMEQQQQYQQWQYGAVDAQYNLHAKTQHRNSKLSEHVHQTVPDPSINQSINTVGTNYYTDQFSKNKFNKNTSFSKPIAEYTNSQTKSM